MTNDKPWMNVELPKMNKSPNSDLVHVVLNCNESLPTILGSNGIKGKRESVHIYPKLEIISLLLKALLLTNISTMSLRISVMSIVFYIGTMRREV